MNSWGTLARLIEPFAPLAATALLGPMGAVVGPIIGKAVGAVADDGEFTVENVIEAVTGSSDAKQKIIDLEADRGIEWVEFTSTAETLEMYRLEAEDANKLTGVPATLGHFFRTSWRPLFGLTMSAMVLGVVYSIVIAAHRGEIEVLTALAGLLGAGTVFFAGCFAVLGVNVHGRTTEKTAGLK